MVRVHSVPYIKRRAPLPFFHFHRKKEKKKKRQTVITGLAFDNFLTPV